MAVFSILEKLKVKRNLKKYFIGFYEKIVLG